MRKIYNFFSNFLASERVLSSTLQGIWLLNQWCLAKEVEECRVICRVCYNLTDGHVSICSITNVTIPFFWLNTSLLYRSLGLCNSLSQILQFKTTIYSHLSLRVSHVGGRWCLQPESCEIQTGPNIQDGSLTWLGVQTGFGLRAPLGLLTKHTHVDFGCGGWAFNSMTPRFERDYNNH